MSNLTPYPKGSLKEICKIAFPLMLSSLSGSLMFFCDRTILAHFSIEAMNGVVAAGMPCYIFHFGLIGIAAIAEVFVGQFNGANKINRLGEPVWQMIWLCLALAPVFILISIYGAQVIIPDNHQTLGKPYFTWYMATTPLFGLVAALSSFFIGQGKVLMFTVTVLLSNIINVVLDIILIFGIDGIIEPLGTKGAALSTMAAQFVQVGILFIIFILPTNRINKGSANWRFNFDIFKNCLRLGIPSSLSHVFEISMWTILIYMVASVSDDHLTVMAIGQNLFILSIFISEGLSKGVTATSANFIGAGEFKYVSKSLKSALLVHGIFVILIAIPLIIFPKILINNFLQESSHLYYYAKVTAFFVWVYFIFDGVTWTISGVLTASGDTLYVMYRNTANSILFALIPVYVFVVYNSGSPGLTWKFTCLYSFINAVTFYWRYSGKRWQIREIYTPSLGLR